MAHITVTGLEEMERLLQTHAQEAEEAAPRMVQAGGEVLAKAQREEIERMGLVDTGALRDSITVSKVKRKDDEVYVEVYPAGKDAKGVLNSTKGYFAEYGKKSKPARPYATVANQKSEKEVSEAMRKAWEGNK